MKLLLETTIEDLKLEKVPLLDTIRDMEERIVSLSNDLSLTQKAVSMMENERDQSKDKLVCQLKRIKKAESEARSLKREIVLLAGLEKESEVKAKIGFLYGKLITGDKK